MDGLNSKLDTLKLVKWKIELKRLSVMEQKVKEKENMKKG